jgi:hypothetical protein
MGRRDADKPVSPFGHQAVTTLVAGTHVKPLFLGIMGGASKASQSGLCKSTKRQLEVHQKAKRTGPGEPGPMRIQQGLLPCQFIVRCWLPVF